MRDFQYPIRLSSIPVYRVSLFVIMIVDSGRDLGTIKVLDIRRRGLPIRRLCNTPQGEAIEGNAADDILMVDQEGVVRLTVI